jgi:lipoprotein-releasing system permease protein
MLKSPAGVTGVMVQGILPDAHARVSKLKANLREGSLALLAVPKGPTGTAEEDDSGAAPISLLLGSELRGQLDAAMGEELTLFSPVFRQTAVGMLPRMGKGKVAGSFQTGYYEYDSSLVYMRLMDAQKLFDAAGQANYIAVRAKNLEDAGPIRDKIQSMDDGVSFWVADWQRMNQNLFKALQMEKLIMFLILGCMVLVSAVNIVSTLIMVVMEKQKEIGVLRSLGFTKGSVLRTFLLQGVYIGSAGAGLCRGPGRHGSSTLSHQDPGGSVYIETLPVQVQSGYLYRCGGLFAPACWRQPIQPRRLDPVEAIRE